MNPRPARIASPATHVARPALRRIRRTFALILCATGAALLLSAAAAHAVNPTPAQLFYVPFPEDQLLQGLQAINSADPTNPVTTYISIAAVADGTIIYYDQWENGYDGDIANPTNLYSGVNPGGTQIWGDGNPANGAPPGLGSDLINAGTVIILNNNVTTTNLSAIDFDGRDKIAATKTVAVSHTAWAAGSGTLLAGSVEVFDTGNWGTDYRAPVGANIPDADDHQMFEYTSLAIQAGEGGAIVQIDKDNSGGFETTVTLAEGESYFVNGGVNVGGHVVSNRPVQVDILTGDIGSNYESRDSGLLPTNLWSNSSYTPVSTASTAQNIAGTATTVWLYNPGASTLAVSYTTRNGGGALTTTTLNVPAGSYLSQVIPDGFGAHFETVSAPFYAFSTTNSTDTNTGGNQAWDWGFTLIPEDALTPQVLIGLGIGRDPTSTTNVNEDGNPVWVTPVGNGDTAVTVYIDFDANPNTGALTDPNGNKYDTSVSLKELERAKIYDTTDRNQTGLLAYVLTSGVKLAAAWGQDPTTASAAAPGLDVGTGVPPLPLFSVGKNGTLSVDADGDGFVSPGDTILYTIAVSNISRAPVPNLRLTDNIPAGTAYVAGTTTLKIGTGAVNPIPDDGSGTPFPLDGTGRILDSATALPVGGSYEVTFKVTINSFATLPSGTSAILNVCTATSLGITQTCRDNTPIYGRIGDFVWLDINGNGVQDGGSEVGIGNVTINLYVDLNGNGVIDGADSIVATQITNGSGGYLFTGVPAGTYVVDVATTNPSLANLTLTTANDPKAVTLAGGEWRLDVDFGYRNLCVQTNGSAVVCSNGNECADPGTCQPATGLCSAPVPKANGTTCTTDNNACTVDTCQAGACAHTAGNSGAVCRAANGACDVAETCNGTSTSCPADGFASSSTVCRGSAGTCDVAESCTGSSAACPSDVLLSNGTVCRAANGVCDVAETCNGSSAACPTDGFAAGTTVCRAAVNECDLAEQCTGSSGACPADTNKPNGTACTDDNNVCTTDSCQAGACTHPAGNAGTTCRGATDLCDLAEVCNGTSTNCPTDGVKANGTECRAANGVCDVAEACNGTAKTCPTDGFASSSTVCRTSAGACDVAEQCTGSSGACPADGFAASTTVCRTSAGACDVVEQCTGSSASCPTDGFASSSTVCRGSAGVCDVAEQCTGSSAACPSDGFAPSTTVCRSASNECDVAEACTGSAAACPTDGFKPNGTTCTDDNNVCTTDSCQTGTCAHPAGNAGTECRAANGVCDVAEACNGTSTNCPTDGVKANGTECRAANGVCDVAEACNGSAKTCPTDGFASSSTVCRTSAGACDVAEQCTGSSAACPADGYAASTTVCRTSAGACDVVEQCTGSSASCPTDTFASSSTVCRGSAGVCDVAEQCTGSSATCPTDGFASSSTVCRSASNECDVAEACSGSAAACPTDGFKPNGTTCTDDNNVCTTDSCQTGTCAHPAGNAGTECRAANGVCDVAEACNGTSTNCPTDGVKANGTECRAANGVCDVAEACNGTAKTCPTDGFSPSSTVCRVSAGACDVAEQCTGSSGACPNDGFAANTTVCRPANGACDLAETCTGTGTACPADGFAASGVLCRAANGVCDVAETCNGTSGACPTDGVKANGVVCRAASGTCDVAETCNGTGTACPTDGFAASGTVCRAANGACDLAETCSGTSGACPTDGVKPSGTVCRVSAGVCDVAESCNGTSGACPNDGFVAAGTQCRAANGQCDVAEACTGSSAACPTDVPKPNGSSCADGDLCTQTDTCQGGSCVGSNPVQCSALDQCHTPGSCEPTTGQCSNPTVPDGTQCSDGDLCSAGDQCQGGICTGVTTLCELCHDLEDNDNDGLIDCLDPDCPTCPPIVDTCHHPCVTSVLFQRTGPDLLRLQASFKPFTPIDPATEQVGLLITNANGVVFADLLGPGAVKRVGKSWVVTVKNAKKVGGIFKMRMLLLADGSYRVNFKAYGVMKPKITLPQMSVQILVGDDVAISTQTWETIKTGWRVQLE